MAVQGRELYEFGPFRLDADKRVLLRDDQPVPLQMKAFETLLVLVRNGQQVVLKDELMKAVWPDTFVDESNLAQNIFVLRKALRGGADNPFIVTVPGRGYRFAEHVRGVPEDAIVVQRHARAHVVIEETVPSTPTAQAIPPTATTASKWFRTRSDFAVLALAVFFLIAALVFLLRPDTPPPRVTGIHQLTHLGVLVHNTHLVTDGPRIYFRVWNEKRRELRSISSHGGEILPVDFPIKEMDLDAISPDSSEFLAVNLADLQPVATSSDRYYSLWRVPVPTGSPRSTGIVTHEAVWSPDGRTVAYSFAAALFQANLDGTQPTRLAIFPDEPFYLSWAPDGKRIRFTTTDSTHTRYDIWQADLSNHSVRSVVPDLPSSARPWAGGWTPDGKYFFYTAVNDGVRNVYAVREKNDLFRRTSSQPVQITNGPLTFYLPLPSKDGKHLFAVGDQQRGELVRYDSVTRQFVPYSRLSADHLAFSRDGQWVAYIEFPECTLVRSRIDGSERRQLTFPPMRALWPQWSPDGSQIAFQAAAQSGAPSKIYLVSPSQGAPVLAAPTSPDRQTSPSWTSEGQAIVYVSSDSADAQFELHLLNLKDRRISTLPDAEGLSQAQISPDGRSVVAVNHATYDLMLYDVAKHQARVLSKMADYPRWSADGKFVYFNDYYFNLIGRNGGIRRWNASTGAVEMLVKFPDFVLTGVRGITFSLTPDGSILMLKDVSNRDLYALDLSLP